MRDPLISVIMPVYNAGNNIHNCINSIISQEFYDIELICVLDCPTDGSDTIIREYAQKDDRIVVIENKRNLNIGESRNVGLKVARGEYIAFSDHDDITLPQMYKNLYALAKSEDADIVLGVPEYVDVAKHSHKAYYYPKTGNVKTELLKYIIGRGSLDTDDWRFFYSHGVIWDKIYRKALITNNKIKFVDNNKTTFEDNLFVIECLQNANKAVVFNEIVYQHVIYENNTSKSADYKKKERIISYIEQLFSILEKYSIVDKYAERYANSSMRYLIGCVTRSILSRQGLLHTIKTVLSLRKMPRMHFIVKNVDYLSMIRESYTIPKKIIYTAVYVILR